MRHEMVSIKKITQINKSSTWISRKKKESLIWRSKTRQKIIKRSEDILSYPCQYIKEIANILL